MTSVSKTGLLPLPITQDLLDAYRNSRINGLGAPRPLRSIDWLSGIYCTLEGIGVEFVEVEAKDQAMPEKWLADEKSSDNSYTHLLVGGLFFLLVAIIAAIALIIS